MAIRAYANGMKYMGLSTDTKESLSLQGMAGN